MNNVISFKGQKVAGAFAHLDPGRDLGSGITSGGMPILGYRGKNWSLRYQGQTHNFVREDDGTKLTYIDCIIVGVADQISKTFFPPGEFDEDSASGPVCSSVKGDAPDPGVPEPQSRTCGTCKNNAWTTLPNGRRGKLCQDSKRLAILLMPAVTKKMLGTPLLEPVYLKIPPGSLTSLKSYGELLRHESFPFAAVVTRISFSPDKLFEMTFEGKQALTDKEAPLVLPLIEDPRTKRIIGESPEIREAISNEPRQTIPPPKPKPPERVETGLEAFGSIEKATKAAVAPVVDDVFGAEPEIISPKKPRGRPAKVANGNGNGVVEALPEQPELPGLSVPMDEEDSELDRELSALLDQKTENMLK